MAEHIELDTGALSVSDMRAILESLPADCTFADAQGITRFYTGRYRIFDRRPGHIGTSVVDCHPPEVRGRVAQLLSELSTGWRDEAVFLTEKDGRQVHVRYLPVRDADDTYRGVLEIAQWVDEIAP